MKINPQKLSKTTQIKNLKIYYCSYQVLELLGVHSTKIII